MLWEDLTNRYKESGIVLALGAGVSIGARLPSWKELVERLASEPNYKGAGLDFADLIEHGVPLPVIASVLEEYSSNREQFVECVRKALYKEFPFFPNGVSKVNRGEFVGFIKENNSTLHAIATLCAEPLVSKEGTKGYRANPLIRGIVTFNLDAVLQAYVYARFEKRLLRTIERASASSTAGKINAYHMHGFLRFDQQAGDRSKEAPDSVILTEQDYFNFFNDPTSLFNYTFLYLLREATCLFVGLSMQDENIRRMLHLSKLERMRALEREGVLGSPARAKSLRHFAILKKEAPRVDKAVEDSLLPLGTRVLWVDGWEEIPGSFRLLYESTGNDWSVVS
jgi:hypothetical protein